MLKKMLKKLDVYRIGLWVLIAMTINEGITSLITKEYVSPTWCFAVAFFLFGIILRTYEDNKMTK